MIAQISCIYSVIGKIKCVKGTDGLSRVKKDRYSESCVM